MNFKSIGLSAMLTGTATAIVFAAAPAQAASIQGETLNFGGTARLENADAPNTQLDFFTYDDSAMSGLAFILPGLSTAFGTPGSTFSVGDLNLTKTGASTWNLAAGPVVNWLNGLDNNVKFTLNSFALERFGTGVNTAFEADIEGIFTPSNLDGTGSFTSQGRLRFNSGSSFSADITAGEQVPTPALLPGLVGMGVAALRKRKSEELETEEA